MMMIIVVVDKKTKTKYLQISLWVCCLWLNLRVVTGNAIVVENSKLGSRLWRTNHSDTPWQGPQGFSTRFAVEPGDNISFKISCQSSYELTIYRLGYYGGFGARLYEQFNVESPHRGILDDTLSAHAWSQPHCRFNLGSRMVDCSNWRVSVTWAVPSNATSGIYIAVPITSRENGYHQGSYIPFVVRMPLHSSAASDILFKTSDTTWVAYNKFGGWNLYRGNGSFNFHSRAFAASYNRPFSNRLPKLSGGQHQNFLFGTEFPMLYWLEKRGYDVSYASCSCVEQLDAFAGLNVGGRNDVVKSIIGRFKVLISVGHDEYWTAGLRRAFENARQV
jgi:hypothetical protein